MKFIDMHCDTLMHYFIKESHSLYKNDMQVDFLKMKDGGALAQFFAVFFPPENEMKVNDDEYFKKLLSEFLNEVKTHNDLIAIAKNYDDIILNKKNNKMSAVLTIEDSRFFNNDLKRIKDAYDKGVRVAGLTWNFENCIGYPNGIKTSDKGLKKFGIEAVEFMNELGMVVDVSHLSDAGFYDVVKYSKKPFFATHSNARMVTNHQRNLTDDMLKKIGDTGSVTGLNFCPTFVLEGENITHTTIKDLVIHAKHIVNKAGIESLAIGSDFDGISGTQEISTSKDMNLLYIALEKAGFYESEIEKIANKNALRVIKASMR